jgi:cysteine-rich repeat protein
MRIASHRALLSFAVSLLAALAITALWPAPSRATGEGCGLFTPCAHNHDYCRFVDIFTSICTARGDAGDGCSGVGQGTCLSGLVCDVIGECRHNPPRLGEPCGIGVGCASGLACSADIGGRCFAPGGAGDACSGIGQGSCATGLVCDANRTCRHDPPEFGEPCGIGVACAESLVCSAEIGGVCEARGGSTDPCRGIGQGTCATGLVCDILGECRSVPSELGELCGTGVSCIASLGCSAEVAGRCEPRDLAGETCSGVGQGSCEAGLVCDANRTCRHDPPELGEPCGTGVPCIASLGCSAEIGGVCQPRDEAGETCSGFGQGSCQAGLVCDALRVCRHDPPQANEPCGIGVDCSAGHFCQPGSQRCRVSKTVGEGCSVFNQCREGLSCEPCFTSSCSHPLQCFPNANEGAITEQQCRTLYSPGLHQAARDLGLTMTYGAGDGIAGVVAESQQFGVAYAPDGRYGCFTQLCGGVDLDVEITASVCVGFSSGFDGGSSWEIFEEAEIAGVGNFSTSQIFPLISLSPLQLGPLDGTTDCLSIGVSPDLGLIPVSAGVYVCESVLDTVIGGAGQLPAALCGDGKWDTGEGCDDANTQGGDGCSATCTVEALCGDGALDLGEACDDGNTLNGDGCSSLCRFEPRCGDGNLDAGEACDDGSASGGDGCSALCRLEPSCGNGLLDASESCDDGNTAAGDGCSATCSDEAPGDVDGDADVDRNDASLLLSFRGQPLSACRHCDLDGDGAITALDGRKLVLLCTRPRCAAQ